MGSAQISVFVLTVLLLGVTYLLVRTWSENEDAISVEVELPNQLRPDYKDDRDQKNVHEEVLSPLFSPSLS